MQLDTRLFREDVLELAVFVFGCFLAISVPKRPRANDTLDRPAAALRLPELRVGQVGAVKLAVDERCFAKVRAAEVRAEEVRAVEVRAAEVCAAEVRAAEVRAAEVRAAEVCAAEARAVEVCAV